MKVVFLFLFFINVAGAAVKFDVRWTENFRKELVVSCDLREGACRSLCQKDSSCVFPESACRDCIGTGLRMSHLIEELGNTIQNDAQYANLNRVLDLVVSGNFVSLIPNDPYNVIDGVNSLRGLRKFEALCPVGSKKQILLLSVDPDTRKLGAPEFVVCDFYGRSYFYGVTSDPSVLVEDGNNLIPLF